ncbi:hypothetical protein FRC07_013136, partial [Ceratobasidium sp. 392]
MDRSRCPFIGAEYNGRKVLIRRSVNYAASRLATGATLAESESFSHKATVSLVKRTFKALHSVPVEQIYLAAFILDAGDTFEIPEDTWTTVLSQISSVKVIVDSYAPGPAERTSNLNAKHRTGGVVPKPEPEG